MSQGGVSIGGDPNLRALSQIGGGATVSLNYSYIPVGSPGGGGGDGSVITNWGGPPFGGTGVLIWSPDTRTTAPQTFTIGGPAGWTNAVNPTRFDPTLGTLDAVSFSVTVALSGTVKAENLGATPAMISADETATVSVLSPTGSPILGSPAQTSWSSLHAIGNGFASSGYNLGAYDGATDFAGTSGTTVALTGYPGWISNQDFGAAADLTAFTGWGTIAVPVQSSGNATVHGPAQSLTETTLDIGATVSVSYVYRPAAPASPGPAPAFGPLDRPAIGGSGGATPSPGHIALPRPHPAPLPSGHHLGALATHAPLGNQGVAIGAGLPPSIGSHAVAADAVPVTLDYSTLTFIGGASLSAALPVAMDWAVVSAADAITHQLPAQTMIATYTGSPVLGLMTDHTGAGPMTFAALLTSGV